MNRVACALFVCLAYAAPVAAQQNEPIGRFAADVRGIFARHKTEPSVANDLGLGAANLPPRSFGLVGGGHVYVWHSRRVTLGVGAEMAWARGSRTADIVPATGSTTTTTPATPTAPAPTATVRRHFFAIVPEVSLNFGHRNGWSYISGGMFGTSKLYLDRADAPSSNVPRRRALNYGGGARWFTNERIAFSVDFHWYSIAEQPAATGIIFEPRTTLLVLSGGIAIR